MDWVGVWLTEKNTSDEEDTVVITLLRIIVGVGGISGALVWAIARLLRSYKTDDYGNRRRVEPIRFRSFVGPIVLAVVAILFLVALSGAAQVPATHIAVAENTWTGQFFPLGPGTHVFPFESRLWPLMTKVTLYDLRRQIIEIGGEPAGQKGVQADSSSPGRPVVYFWARGWAYPNQAMIVDLHRKYGSKYLDDWVERIWVAILKSVQGSRPYDFVGENRVEFANLVESKLQEELGDLVIVSQLAIVDYDFSQEVNAYLDKVAEMSFKMQQAAQQIEINRKEQEAAQIKAETDYLVAKRGSETQRIKVETEAEGNANAQKKLADAEAYQIKAKYQAESEGIAKVQQALAQSPDAYLQYQLNARWNGQLPQYMFGESVLPFLNIPTSQ